MEKGVVVIILQGGKELVTDRSALVTRKKKDPGHLSFNSQTTVTLIVPQQASRASRRARPSTMTYSNSTVLSSAFLLASLQHSRIAYTFGR